MRKLLILCGVVFWSWSGLAAGGEIGNMRWNQANLAHLRSFDKTAVVEFLNEGTGNLGLVVTEQDVWEYEWVDLAGDGRYELAVIASSGPCCVVVGIIRQDSAGKLSDQHFDGAGSLKDAFKDLDGDGKKELILWPEVAQPGSWTPMTATPRWPAVYRLENDKYVEASRDFPNFYDSEILPKLDHDIRRAKNPQTVAILTLERDKVLRLLGRDPTAGLTHAYEWMSSGDPQMLQCAVATFRDIGGHDKEMREAQQAIPAAFKKELAARGGRS
jgi:hypothetical protein